MVASISCRRRTSFEALRPRRSAGSVGSFGDAGLIGSTIGSLAQSTSSPPRLACAQMSGPVLAAVKNLLHRLPGGNVLVDIGGTDGFGRLGVERALQPGELGGSLLAIPGVAVDQLDAGEAGRLHGPAIARRRGHAERQALGGDVG